MHAPCAVMQAGFAMLEVGSVGSKHTKNLLIKVRTRPSSFAASYRFVTFYAEESRRDENKQLCDASFPPFL